jgi:hypothetical protein
LNELNNLKMIKITSWYDVNMSKMTNASQISFNDSRQWNICSTWLSKDPSQTTFDIKMDFTRKARLGRGHVTDATSTLTYSSDVSRERVRLFSLRCCATWFRYNVSWCRKRIFKCKRQVKKYMQQLNINLEEMRKKMVIIV